MTRRMVCAVNESAHGQRALDVAIEIARGCSVPLVLAIVNEPEYRGSRRPRYSEDDLEGILDRAAAKAKAAGVGDVKRAACAGDDVARAIVECAKEVDADHIVVGTGNPPLIGRLLMGSVSEDVVRRAGCTVTLAR